jgi:Ca-activated chloride channel family protein
MQAESRRPKRLGRGLGALIPYGLTLLVIAPLALYCAVLLRGSEVRFHQALALGLVGVVPLVAWMSFHRDRRRQAALLFSRTRDLLSAGQGWTGRLVHLPRALRLGALAALVVMLARPQRLSLDSAEVEGIDIVVALDVSNSMSENDLVPPGCVGATQLDAQRCNRLGAAKKVIDDFIARRPFDRVGLVIFGKEAYTQCPLTLDHRAVRGLLGEVQLGLVDGRGTAIGNALGTAINRLRKSEAKSRVVVLVTDGDDNASKIDPRQTAKFAQSFGIKVFTILIGQDVQNASLPPGLDRFGNLVRPRTRYPVNPRLLEEIADQTGGMPYLATDTEALEKRFQAILEDLDRSKLKSATPHYAEMYPLLIVPALGLTLLEILLSLTRFRRFP